MFCSRVTAGAKPQDASQDKVVAPTGQGLPSGKQVLLLERRENHLPKWIPSLKKETANILPHSLREQGREKHPSLVKKQADHQMAPEKNKSPPKSSSCVLVSFHQSLFLCSTSAHKHGLCSLSTEFYNGVTGQAGKGNMKKVYLILY